MVCHPVPVKRSPIFLFIWKRREFEPRSEKEFEPRSELRSDFVLRKIEDAKIDVFRCKCNSKCK
jgi:hypothetical protein